MWHPLRFWFDLKAEFRLNGRTIRGREAARALREQQQRRAADTAQGELPVWKSILLNLAGSGLAGAAAYSAAFGIPTTGAGWSQFGGAALMAALFNQTGLHQNPPASKP